jgi:cellulose synthase/poly-beta-1,6-N-acetylglucosamine synthase-like glycosyltransferase
MEQDYPKNKIKLIIVDSASEDTTASLIESFIRENGLSDFEFIKEPERKGKASALNGVLKHCVGEVVVITDADACWEKDTLRRIVLHFSNPNIGAVTGRQVLLNPNQNLSTKVERTYRFFFDVLRLGESCIDSTPIFNGPLMAFRSNLLEPIPEDTIADDSQLAVKIRKKGFKSIYDPSAVFYEYAPFSYKSRFSQKLRRGQGLIQLFFREREVMFNSSYEKFGTIIFPAEFFMHIISPALLFLLLILLFPILFITSLYISVGLVVAFGVIISILTLLKMSPTRFLASFLSSQFILLTALVCYALRRPQHKWNKVKDVRDLWKEK